MSLNLNILPHLTHYACEFKRNDKVDRLGLHSHPCRSRALHTEGKEDWTNSLTPYQMVFIMQGIERVSKAGP